MPPSPLIVASTVGRAFRNMAVNWRQVRRDWVPELWIQMRLLASADRIERISVKRIEGLSDQVITAHVDEPNRAILAGLCRITRSETFFEIGTNRGRTTWCVVSANPQLRAYTLDLPSAMAARAATLEITDERLFETWNRGAAFSETPEANRITQLWGDSATFDYSAYAGKIDVVYVDGSHSYSYVRNDTEAALKMLSPKGLIVWDDFPGYTGVFSYLLELSDSLDKPLYHISGTRMVLYSRQSIVGSWTPLVIAPPVA